MFHGANVRSAQAYPARCKHNEAAQAGKPLGKPDEAGNYGAYPERNPVCVPVRIKSSSAPEQAVRQKYVLLSGNLGGLKAAGLEQLVVVEKHSNFSLETFVTRPGTTGFCCRRYVNFLDRILGMQRLLKFVSQQHFGRVAGLMARHAGKEGNVRTVLPSILDLQGAGTFGLTTTAGVGHDEYTLPHCETKLE